MQASSDQTSGFRISAGGLACADEITLTLRFDNGQSEKVTVDGCKLFS
jgi:NifU-like protein involved in Fe-S cluster formation